MEDKKAPQGCVVKRTVLPRTSEKKINSEELGALYRKRAGLLSRRRKIDSEILSVEQEIVKKGGKIRTVYR